MKKSKYEIQKSPLYKLSSPKKLSELLGFELKELEKISRESNNYECWKEKESGRYIEHPKPVLESIHIKLGKYLSRIKTPDYLHSSVEGRSYITNAKAHTSGIFHQKLDIKKFYPSTKFWHVYQFFIDDMKCPKDVATMLTRLLTKATNADSHLATGSPASPILAYFSHKKMFDKIHDVAQEYGITMTCYVDDITFSGNYMPKTLINRCMAIIASRKLEYHTKKDKLKFYGPARDPIITGCAISEGKVTLPYKRYRRIHDDCKIFFNSTDAEKKKQIDIIYGKVSEASQLEKSFIPLERYLLQQKRYLKKR